MILYNWDKMACSDWKKCLREERVRLWSCIIGMYVRCRKGEREKEKCVENFVEEKKEKRKKKRGRREKTSCVHKFLENQKR